MRTIRKFVVDPDLKATTEEFNFRTQAKVYEIYENGLLARRAEPPKYPIMRRVITTANEAYSITTRIHCQRGHVGKNGTFEEAQKYCYGITREEVSWVLRHCKIHMTNKPTATKTPLQPIVVNKVFERVQMDLIDMSAVPDGEYHWILHIKDHFSKYTVLRPLRRKLAALVAAELLLWIQFFGPPKIIQCDNGSEFKGEVIELLSLFMVIHGIHKVKD